jgi:uncharacterized radical SAM superfamily Fe-S cluster-containing enzyme
MTCCEEQALSETESVCPECLARIPATRVARGDDVYLKKACPAHGDFSTVIWRGLPAYATWVRPKIPSYPDNPFTTVDRGCPFDCGLCPDHRQQSCCVLFEVTQRCDLHCPVCFADAGNQPASDPGLHEIKVWYRRLLEAGGPFNIQLSGGEPCLRDDLPDIIALGRSLGFTFFQVNTNGLRLSRDADYLKRLQEAGLSTVFLQFDGTCDCVYEKLRGRSLAAHKQAVIERCAEQQVGVVLVPTLVPSVNVDDIGGIIEFAVQHAPTVRGVHFQPISYFGRYPHPPRNADRVTIPEIIRAIEAQTGGAIKCESFSPPGGENALCSFHGNFVLMPDGQLTPLTKHSPETSCCCQPVPAKQGAAQSREFVARQWAAPKDVIALEPASPSLGEWDVFLARARTHTFCISGMAFQDAWNLDLERLKDCYIHTASPDGRLVPFCAYNLTDQRGRSLYRQGNDQERLELFQRQNAISGTVAKEATGCLPATRKTVQETVQSEEPHRSGCMVCGADLIYSESGRDNSCHYCGQVVLANAWCTNGHFVCDACHRADAVEIIKKVCSHSRETDPVALMQTIRSHSHFRIHGPEHHSLVPAVILTALRNSGNSVTDEQIITAIQRGQMVAGGSCAFLGACGAAIGVGIAVSLLLGANPYDGDKRQTAQRATQKVLGEIASYNAPRCCQRDSWLALKVASTLLQEYTGKSLAVRLLTCEQFSENKECIHERCPLWPSRQ